MVQLVHRLLYHTCLSHFLPRPHVAEGKSAPVLRTVAESKCLCGQMVSASLPFDMSKCRQQLLTEMVMVHGVCTVI